MFVNHIYGKGLVSKIYKEYLKNKNKTWEKQKIDLKGGENLNMHITKGDEQVPNKHMKRWTKSSEIREIQLKQDITTHLLEWLRFKKLTGVDVEEWNSHSLSVGMQNAPANLENSSAVSFKSKNSLTVWSSNHTTRYLPNWYASLYPHKVCMWILIAAFFLTTENWR